MNAGGPDSGAGARAGDDPRAVLARHGLRAKKAWGQNFLVDRTVVDRIARAVGGGPGDVVVEIGAGLGTLTAALLAQAPGPARVIAVEREPDMLAVLDAELARTHADTLRIAAADAVTFDYAGAAELAGLPDARVIVAGNLPYQITSPILFALVGAGAAVQRAVVMVQREFAERAVAAPGGKVYGRLSVMLQQAMEVKLLFHVRPGSFHPRPRVTSSVLSLARRPAPLAPIQSPALFARVVRETFSTRRKMLRRSLSDAFGAQAATAALATAALAGELRPEVLSIGQFGRLCDGLWAAGVRVPETDVRDAGAGRDIEGDDDA